MAKQMIYIMGHGKREDSKVGDPKNTTYGLTIEIAPIVDLIADLYWHGRRIDLLVMPVHGIRFRELREMIKIHPRITWPIRRMLTDIVGSDVCRNSGDGMYYTGEGEALATEEYFPVMDIIPFNEWWFMKHQIATWSQGDILIVAASFFIERYGWTGPTSGTFFEVDCARERLKLLMRDGHMQWPKVEYLA